MQKNKVLDWFYPQHQTFYPTNKNTKLIYVKFMIK